MLIFIDGEPLKMCLLLRVPLYLLDSSSTTDDIKKIEFTYLSTHTERSQSRHKFHQFDNFLHRIFLFLWVRLNELVYGIDLDFLRLACGMNLMLLVKTSRKSR